MSIFSYFLNKKNKLFKHSDINKFSAGLRLGIKCFFGVVYFIVWCVGMIFFLQLVSMLVILVTRVIFIGLFIFFLFLFFFCLAGP